MLVLGLDPGIAKFGYGLVAHERGSIRMVDAGVLLTPAHQPAAERLAVIGTGITALLNRHTPDMVVIERLIPGPGRNLGAVAEARGVALYLAGLRKLPVAEESARAVKALTTRHGGATKLQMRKTVQRLLQLPELPSPDAADALAIALQYKGFPTWGQRS